MDLLDMDELEQLVAVRGTSAVSIYMPTLRAGAEVRQNAVRFRNLLREAEDRLVTIRGLRGPEARGLLESAQALVDDDGFWQHQEDGLAAFAAPGFFRAYRLPLRFEDLILTSDRFHIRPILPTFSGDGRFYVLALSQKAVRLLRASRYSVVEVPLPGVPRSLEEALKYDDPERQLQLRVGTPTGTGAIFHGHGVGIDDSKENIQRFFQQVNKGLREFLRDEHAPLVLAGVDYLLPIYRDANTYGHLVADGIPGNPDALKPQELHQQAWARVEPYFEAQARQSAAMYHERVGTGLASHDLREIVPAAYQGRIDRLFVPLDAQRWGRFDPRSGAVQLHDAAEPDDEELYDLAAIHTILKRGTVFAVEREKGPGPGEGLAAVFRY